MTAAVMSNYYYPPGGWRPVADSRLHLQNWMYAQMAQYPPPPQPNQHHYNAMYPTAVGAQQLLDSPDQLQYNDINQIIYPKVDSTNNGQSASTHQMHNLAQQLQQQGSFDDRQLQQPLQQTAQAATHVHNAPTSQDMSQQGNSDQSQKTNRLRKACDSCSIRKVKCDESGPPCRACAALDIPCTFERPSRRRGPPNRHAEAIKRRRMEEPTESSLYSRGSSPASPTHAAQALAALSSRTSAQQPTAESICSIQMLEPLIDDFFTYLHPIYPFPHEPTFREAWKRREDNSNSAFLALLASMVGATVSAFPRKPRLHLNTRIRSAKIPNSLDLVNNCQKICSIARGPGYLDNESLNVYDAATSFFLGLIALHTHRWQRARVYFGECMSILRGLGMDQRSEEAFPPLRHVPASLGLHNFKDNTRRQRQIDNITQEMGARIYWAYVVKIRQLLYFGSDFGEVAVTIPALNNALPPPLPSEVDDLCIYPTHNEPQLEQHQSMITGFNINVTPFQLLENVAGVAPSHQTTNGEWQRQIKALQESLQRCRSLLDQLPPALSNEKRRNSPPHQRANGVPSARRTILQPRFNKDPAASIEDSASPQSTIGSLEHRRQVQYAIQAGTIHTSILSARLYFISKMWELNDRLQGSNAKRAGVADKSPNMESYIQRETTELVKDVLATLGNVSEVNMEPNADDYVSKPRAIANALLSWPKSWRGDLLNRAEQPLSGFLQTLLKLEHVDSNEETSADNDANKWFPLFAELSAYQAQLIELAS